MSKDRRPRPTADDDADEEETALDLRIGGAPSIPRAPTPREQGAREPPPRRRAFVDDVPSETAADPLLDDDDATEFLVRRPAPPPASRTPVEGSGPALVARGRAVPLGDAPQSVPPSAPPPEPAAHDQRTEPFARELPKERRGSAPSAAAPGDPLPRATPRPLPRRSTSLPSALESQTGSAPLIHRLQLPEPGAPPPVPEPTPPPSAAAAAAQSASGGKAPRARPPAAPPPSETFDEEDDTTGEAAALGILVVDVPPDATVYVNGVERGRGPVRVDDVDRYAKHALRVHCPGHHAWTGTVALDGKPALKVKPALKKRGG